MAAPGGWLRGRLLRLRTGEGRASALAARLLARVGVHPSDAAAQQASTGLLHRQHFAGLREGCQGLDPL